MTARCVVRAPAAQRDCPVAHVLAPLPFLAEPVGLELKQRGEGEGVVRAGHVDVFRAHAGVVPEPILTVVAGGARDRAMLIVHVGTRLGHTADHAENSSGRVAIVVCAFHRRHDQTVGVVGLDAAVEHAQRVADHAAGEHVLDAHALPIVGAWIVRCAPGVVDLYVSHLLGRRSVLVHMAHEGVPEHLRRADLPIDGTEERSHAREAVPGAARARSTHAPTRRPVH